MSTHYPNYFMPDLHNVKPACLVRESHTNIGSSIPNNISKHVCSLLGMSNLHRSVITFSLCTYDINLILVLQCCRIKGSKHNLLMWKLYECFYFTIRYRERNASSLVFILRAQHRLTRVHKLDMEQKCTTCWCSHNSSKRLDRFWAISKEKRNTTRWSEAWLLFRRECIRESYRFSSRKNQNIHAPYFCGTTV